MAREALYTAQVSGKVTEDMKEHIDRLAETYRVSQGEVIRLAMENDGLKSVEAILRVRRTTGSIAVSVSSPGEVEFSSPFAQ